MDKDNISTASASQLQFKKILFVVAILLGLTYLFCFQLKPFSFSGLLKASPVLLLGVIGLFFTTWTNRDKILYLAATVTSGLGDYFLDIDRNLYLKQALASFLVSLILYIFLFKTKIKGYKYWIAIPFAIFLGVMTYLFYSTAGSMFIPVVLYSLVLCTMAFYGINTRVLPIQIGGILFLIADSLIGINRFLHPFDYSTLIIVSIYMSAQFFIGYGLLFGNKEEAKV